MHQTLWNARRRRLYGIGSARVVPQETLERFNLLMRLVGSNYGTRNGIDIRVAIRNDEIWTAWPTNVPRNP